MRSWFDSVVILTTSAVALATATAAAAQPTAQPTGATVRGEVVRASSRWTADGSRIVTDAVIRTEDGREVTVSQLGGSVDGIGMKQFPGPEILETGMRVAVTAHPASTARKKSVLVVDEVSVEAYPDVLDDTRGETRNQKFVRNGPTKGGNNYLKWASGCVQISYAAEGTSHIAGEGEFAALDRSLASWSGVDCSYINLVSVGKVTGEVGKDRVNLIKFRDTKWCRPAVDDDAERCHPPMAAAITTLAFVDDADSDRDGEIVDADIEFNGVNFSIAIDGETDAPQTMLNDCNADLENTMTHELGHVLGLDHTCLLRGQSQTIDDRGNPTPLCHATDDEEIIEATMYASQDCDETKKRTLDVDDTEAACAIYPQAEDPATCERPEELTSGCCSTGGGGAGSLALGAMTMLALFARRRR